MDIFVTDIKTGASLHFPMLPEKINCQAATRFQTYDIMSVGEIKIPLGEDLTTFSWSGILPGMARGKQPYIKTTIEPKKVQEILSSYRYEGKKLRLLITDTPINHDVYLESYSVEYAGGFGDYTYEVSFVHAKDIIVRTESDATNVSSENKAQERPTPSSNTYTVVKNDSLWSIAQKQMGSGSRYLELYNANKTVIDEMTAKYGSSKYTVYSGQVLIIP